MSSQKINDIPEAKFNKWKGHDGNPHLLVSTNLCFASHLPVPQRNVQTDESAMVYLVGIF